MYSLETSEWLSPNARRYFHDATKTRLLSPEQEIELGERIKKGDPEARDHMIRANLLLVAEIAKKFL